MLGFVGVSVGWARRSQTRFGTLDYPRGMALASVVFLLCVLVEIVSGSIRQALLGVREERRRNDHGVLAALTGRKPPGAEVPVQRRTRLVSGDTGSHRNERSQRISPSWTFARSRGTCYWLQPSRRSVGPQFQWKSKIRFALKLWRYTASERFPQVNASEWFWLV
ncbi:hypothetical protein [Saccharopolyspora spinosa]|uniref:hypothetical protein n=1 Tax=Saccharopolyspora spinosa TaxID=60894 RepID=UPI001ED8DE2D|nr:hypothetical protein [Saccharopolyspora spinosa]